MLLPAPSKSMPTGTLPLAEPAISSLPPDLFGCVPPHTAQDVLWISQPCDRRKSRMATHGTDTE